MLPHLHSDIWKLIFSYLTPTEKVLGRFVCLQWRQWIPPDKYVTLKHYTINDRVYTWALSKRCWKDGTYIKQAARYGTLMPIIDSMKDPKQDYLTWMDAAVKYGHIHILEYAKQNYPDIPLGAWYNDAIRAQQFPVLEWFVANKIACRNDNVCEQAIETGNLEILIWLQQHGHPLTTNCYTVAYKHRDILLYLRQQDCPVDPSICMIAVRMGDLELLKWLRTPLTEGGSILPWDYRITSNARYLGYTQILEWAIENGCPSE